MQWARRPTAGNSSGATSATPVALPPDNLPAGFNRVQPMYHEAGCPLDGGSRP
jgi:hypothetical protein